MNTNQPYPGEQVNQPNTPMQLDGIPGSGGALPGQNSGNNMILPEKKSFFGSILGMFGLGKKKNNEPNGPTAPVQTGIPMDQITNTPAPTGMNPGMPTYEQNPVNTLENQPTMSQMPAQNYGQPEVTPAPFVSQPEAMQNTMASGIAGMEPTLTSPDLVNAGNMGMNQQNQFTAGTPMAQPEANPVVPTQTMESATFGNDQAAQVQPAAGQPIVDQFDQATPISADQPMMDQNPGLQTSAATQTQETPNVMGQQDQLTAGAPLEQPAMPQVQVNPEMNLPVADLEVSQAAPQMEIQPAQPASNPAIGEVKIGTAPAANPDMGMGTVPMNETNMGEPTPNSLENILKPQEQQLSQMLQEQPVQNQQPVPGGENLGGMMPDQPATNPMGDQSLADTSGQSPFGPVPQQQQQAGLQPEVTQPAAPQSPVPGEQMLQPMEPNAGLQPMQDPNQVQNQPDVGM